MNDKAIDTKTKDKFDHRRIKIRVIKSSGDSILRFIHDHKIKKRIP